MPSWRVAERLPAKLGAFDLVIIDEASGADVCELTTLLRGRKILVIGDDKQVERPPLQGNNPHTDSLGDAFLRALPRTIRPFVLPGSSLYDLAKVMFPGNHIHLRDHGHAHRDPIGTIGHSTEPWPIAAAGSAEDAQPDQAIDVFAAHDEPWRSPQTSALDGADVMVDEISKVVARLPGNNRPERPDAVSTIGNLKPAPWDAVRIESPPIAVHQVARLDWPGSERLPETDVKFAELPSLKGDKQGWWFGGLEHVREIRSTEAGLPSWLVDDAARPINAPVDETPLAGEMRAAGPEQNVEAQPHQADARWSVKGRTVAIAAVLLVMLMLPATYWLLGPDASSRLVARISNAIPREFSLSAFAKRSDPFARSAERNLAADDPKQVSTVRVDPPTAGESSSVAPVMAPVAQRAVLYEEDPTDPKGRRYAGGVTWRTENVSPTSGTQPELVVKADLNVVDTNTAMSLTFRRNTDHTMPASHVVEIKFDRPRDAPYGEVSKLHGLLMKQDGKVHGAPLEGEAAKVTPGYFMVGLASGASQLQRNIKLLKENTWFEVVISYSNGSKAILAIDKGSSGEQAFKEAFAAWGE